MDIFLRGYGGIILFIIAKSIKQQHISKDTNQTRFKSRNKSLACLFFPDALLKVLIFPHKMPSMYCGYLLSVSLIKLQSLLRCEG